jgi:hypothetical protein
VEVELAGEGRAGGRHRRRVLWERVRSGRREDI